MRKINTSPLSGMQELLPARQAVFDKLKAGVAEAYRAHGFLNIETPMIDRTEILLSKAGGDTEKQIYKVIKTDEAKEEADQALRFDHTVPLARYVVEHENDLAFPFHATQIGRNFRGERAQKGRFREFYQCDVDVVGRGALPIAYDAKVIAAIYDALQTFGLSDMKIRISNRKVLAGFLEALGLSEKMTTISSIIDHAEKIPREKTETRLRELGIVEEDVVKITTFIDASGTANEVEKTLQSVLGDLTAVEEGLGELKTVFELLVGKGIGDNVVIDLMVVRGLDYYTGTVFETILPKYKEIGSIAGGGRYDNLASSFTDQELPGVGGSIGLTRLFCVLSEYGLLENGAEKNPVDYCLVPVSSNEYIYAMELANKLNAKGKSTDVAMMDKKLGDKLAYAAKVAQNAVVIGEEEMQTGELKVKDLITGDITSLETE